MADATAPAPKTPWHLWLVGVLSLLWNSMGALDFTMTQTRNEVWLKQMTPAQMDWVYAFPLWVVVTWGTATWGSFIGSILLLARRRLTVSVNLVVLLAMVPTFAYEYILTDGRKIMGGGAGTLVFTGAIVLIGVLLFLYARAMGKRGVLR
ncbi:MAG TPA: hypothetical protein VG734_21790 [Lacunisphaera sp.]|nr:hypothetical protein [Lacunisphaera sp.]